MSIFAGRCAEYSISGNLIQGNDRITCNHFRDKPCPMYYPSNHAYKCKYSVIVCLLYVEL